MIQISPDQVTPALASLFSPTVPAGIRALAVLAGGNAGKILTDDPARPRWGLIWEADDGTLYRGGKVDRDVLTEAINLLRHDGVVALGFLEGDTTLGLFPPNPDAGAECLEFDRPIGSSDLSALVGELPAGYAIRRMDRAMLEQSPSLAYHLHRYGTIENFLSRGMALCVLSGGQTVCEARADMEVLGRRELGVTTQEAYRGQGFATIACAHLVKLCEETGSHAYWDCARLNAASVALARKLGFQNDRAYRLLAWFASTGTQAGGEHQR